MHSIAFTPLLVAAVVGVMLFFSVAVAPGIFKVLPAEWAARYVRAFFPKYYAVLGATCALAAALDQGPVGARLIWACAAVFGLSLWPLTPTINRLRDGGKMQAFHALHGLSVGLNLLQLVALCYWLWLAR